MNEEEKKSIEFLKKQSNHWKDFVGKKEEKTIEDIIINLIEKQQKEIEKKDRQIDLMAEYISDQDIDEDICKKIMAITKCNYDYEQKTCIECIKQYFKNKAEEN